MTEELEKIYYDKDGWVCGRYPIDIPVDDKNRYIKVSVGEYSKTFTVQNGYAWRVVDGKLVVEKYGEIPPYVEINELKAKLRDTDYQATKYSEGWFTEEEYAPIKAQRQAWRDRINELEKQ